MKKLTKKQITAKELDRIIELLRQLRVFIEMPAKPRSKMNKVWQKVKKKINQNNVV